MAEYQKLLTFSLGSEEYGLSILGVKELIGMMDFTPVPKTPDFIKGVINLRGKIIPVMDLRLKFGMEPQNYDEKTCIVIISVMINGLNKLLGVVVDEVSEVISISAEQIEPPPEYGSLNDADEPILGIGKIKDEVIIILDINKIFWDDSDLSVNENMRDGCYA